MKRLLVVAALVGGFAVTGCATVHAGQGWCGTTPVTYGAGYGGVYRPAPVHVHYNTAYRSVCGQCQTPLPVAGPYGYGAGTCPTCATAGYRGVGYTIPVRAGYGCGW